MDIKEIVKEMDQWRCQGQKEKLLYVKIPLSSFEWIVKNKISITRFTNYFLEKVQEELSKDKK